ncbi:MAG: DNA polymerase III subunit delta' [Actinomycetaceae bacterium]|nr:DNA polymerase III subunit delta' [Actinomycetaceae bacterium]
MSVWEDVVGQEDACQIFRRAACAGREVLRAQARARPQGRSDANSANSSTQSHQAMTHAWLITGPPGSGRSTAARAFAAALQCEGEEVGCGQCEACRLVVAGTHADVTQMSTQRVIITIKEVAQLVERAQQSPTLGKWTVIIIEDADRMIERTSNLLLKALEEPPPRTVWIICAPSPQDILTTIRSRCRNVNLAIPSFEAVANLLVKRWDVDPQQALQAAHIGQAHIGMSAALVRNPEKLEHRKENMTIAADVRSTSDAIFAADELVKRIKKAVEKRTDELNKQEKQELLCAVGYEDQKRLPPHVRSQLKILEDDQKRRVTRFTRDYLDRLMLDLLALYRDVYTIQVGAHCDLINVDLTSLVKNLAQQSTPQASVYRMQVIAQARERIQTNAAPLLILEAMLVALRPQAAQPMSAVLSIR